MEVIRIQFNMTRWNKFKSNRRTKWFNTKSILPLGIWNCLSVTFEFQTPTMISPVPFFGRKDYFVGWNVGKNTHRRLFSTCLSMFIKCVIIVINLQSKKKMYSSKSPFTKLFYPISTHANVKIQAKSKYFIRNS